MKNVIVIPTHRTGTKFLENLLASFKGYSKYPILIVILGYKESDRPKFLSILEKFSELPIKLETLESNSFELGGLYAAYTKTDYDELLLLSHSCEIVDGGIFDIVFEKYAGHSVAFGVQSGEWSDWLGHSRENESFILKYLDRATSEKLERLGKLNFWQGHIGKYRREILNKMEFLDYLPSNMIEAISQSELLFTSTYNSLDPTTVVLFRDWIDGNLAEEKFGKQRLKISNEYIIKWKSHWTPEMVFEDLKSKHFAYRVRKYARRQAGTALRWFKRQMKVSASDSR